MKISERGQIAIPKPLRNKLGLLKSVEIDVIPVKDGLLIQKRSRGKHPVDEVMGILKRPSNTDRYIEELRGR
jgi:AbrB family looped-hinge helix DNA binding protein